MVRHNVLPREDPIFYRSKRLRRDSPRGFQTRLIFTIGINNGMLPSVLPTATVNKLWKTTIKDRNVQMVQGVSG